MMKVVVEDVSPIGGATAASYFANVSGSDSVAALKSQLKRRRMAGLCHLDLYCDNQRGRREDGRTLSSYGIEEGNAKKLSGFFGSRVVDAKAKEMIKKSLGSRDTTLSIKVVLASDPINSDNFLLEPDHFIIMIKTGAFNNWQIPMEQMVLEKNGIMPLADLATVAQSGLLDGDVLLCHRR